MSATCPWCSAPRDTGPTCPKCGAIYAKAEAIKAHGRAVVAAPEPVVRFQEPVLDLELDIGDAPWTASRVEDASLEWKFCAGAIPAALVLAIVFHASGLMASLQRIFLTMPVHELGHATAAWFCGFTAIPSVWLTIVPETRGFIAPVALLAALGYMGWRGWQAENRIVIGAACALILLQVVLTFGLKLKTAHMVVIFSGDGAGMILATLLMGSFFFGKETQLYKGSLRWGFVVIGAVAFVDMYATWIAARSDFDAIPFGTMNGNPTDPSKLVDEFGWKIETMVNRFVTLGVLCLLALSLVYAWGVRRAARDRDACKAAELLAERLVARAPGG